MKFLKHAALAALALSALTACNKDNVGNESAKGDQTILVKLDLPKLKAAGDPAGVDKEFGTEIPKIKDLAIYLVNEDGTIADVKKVEFVKTTASNYATSDWKQLTDPTENTSTGGGGLKFTKVSAKVKRVVVEANLDPNGLAALVKTTGSWADRTITTTLNGNVYMVGQTSNFKDLGKEPYMPDKDDVNKNINVKQANVTINPIQSRVQIVGLDLYKWESGNAVKDTNSKIIGVVINRFSKTATVAGATLTITPDVNKLYSSSYAGFISTDEFKKGRTTAAANAYQLPINDAGAATIVTDIASYIWNATNGITIDPTTVRPADIVDGTPKPQALAFNFFANNLTSSTTADDATATTPKIHLIIQKQDGSIVFVNVGAFTDNAGAKIEFENGKLYSLNLSKEQEAAPSAGTGNSAVPTPVIVSSDDPTNHPPVVTPDISTKEVNLIARVTVAPWTAVNVKPVFDK